MRLGVCCGPESSLLVRDAGFDFLEWPAAWVLNAGNADAPWQVPQHPLPVETMNLFLRDITIVGPSPSPEEQIRSYVETAARRAASLGVSIIVFGSAGARRIPEGFSTESAEKQLTRFLKVCADAAEAAGVVIAIEPLCSQECNFINSVSEGAAWVRRVNRPGIGLLADTYHMEMEDEDLGVLEDCAQLLVHVHTADSKRKAPGTGSYDHAALLECLSEIGYSGRISIECSWGDMERELGPALSRLRR